MKLVLFLLITLNAVVCFSQKATDTLSLYFTNNNYTPTLNHQAIIDSITHQEDTIISSIDVMGYTNNIGSNEDNNLLSQRRANQIATSIGQEYIGTINWRGELPSNSAKNRRVDLIINYKKAPETEEVTVVKRVTKEPSTKKTEKVANTAISNHKSPEALVNNRRLESVASAEVQVKKEEPKWLKKKLQDTKVGEKIVLSKVTFLRSRDLLLENSYEDLYELVRYLKNNPKVKINIQGHICCGSPQDPKHDGINKRTGKRNLSLARAKRVYQFLRENKIKKSRMTYEGLANEFPTGEKNLSLDRRVEIEIVSK